MVGICSLLNIKPFSADRKDIFLIPPKTHRERDPAWGSFTGGFSGGGGMSQNTKKQLAERG